MSPRKPYSLSPEERAARSARIKARNADPAFRAIQRRHGKPAWSAEARQAAADRLAALRADPGFLARQREARECLKPRPLRLPEHTTPVVRGLFVGMNQHLATFGDVSRRSGVAYDTLRNWRDSMPHVDLLDAALNTLDLELAIVPIGSRNDDGFLKLKKERTKNATV